MTVTVQGERPASRGRDIAVHTHPSPRLLSPTLSSPTIISGTRSPDAENNPTTLCHLKTMVHEHV